MRVVSLNCSNTEIVHALGCADQLVGVDSDSDWPLDVVQALPRLGRDLEIDIANVAALHPDLVLASLTVPGHEHVIEGLRAAGLPFLAPETQSLTDTYADIRAIAAALGVAARGEAVIAAMRAVIEAPPEPTPSPPKILVQWWPKPVIAPGRRSWVTDLITSAGGENPLGEREVKSTPITDADVAAIQPDYVVLSWCGVQPAKYRPDVVLGNPAFADTPAVRNHRVVCIPEAFLGRPGPRLADGSRALRALVRDFAR